MSRLLWLLGWDKCPSCRAWCRSDRIAVHWFVDHGDEIAP